MHLNNGLDIPPRNRDILETSILEILRTYNASMWLAGPTVGEGNYVDSSGTIPLSGVNQVVGYVDDQSSKGEAENAARNSTFAGATDVTPPTGWAGFTTNLGITLSYLGRGTDEYGNYVDVRISGTASGATFPTLLLGDYTTFILTEGEIVSAGGYYQLIAGSLTGITLASVRAQIVSSLGVYVNEAAAANATTSRQFSIASRVCPAGSERGRPVFQANVTNGATVDASFRLWEIWSMRGRLGAYAPTSGSPIYRTEGYVPAYQATTGFKPILAGGMRNELVNSRTLSGWSQTGPGTVTQNAAKALDGSMTATLITRTGTAALFFSRNGARPGTAAIPFSGAVVAKPGIKGRFITVRLQGVYPAYSDVMFDMHSGTVVYTKISGGMTLTKYGMSALKDGYWLCRMVTVDPGGSSAVLSITTKETRTELDNTASAGDSSDVIIDNTAMGFSSDFFEYPFPVNAGVVQEINQSPYSWKFDGVDDRLVVSKPTIPDGSLSHFNICCFKIPALSASGADLIYAGTNPSIPVVRLCQLGLSALAVLQVSWVNDAAVNGSPASITRALGEGIVSTAHYVPSTRTHSVRGTVGAPATTSSSTPMAAPLTVTKENIGCHNTTGTDANFFAGEIYGIISGTGAPSAGELTAMQDFLAGHAGFILIP